MTLLDLPNELLQCILDASRPHGFESFALTCHRLHDLSQPQISSHNQLKKIYTSVHCRSDSDCAHPYALIQRIWTRPLAAPYVRRASCSISPGRRNPPDTQHLASDWPTTLSRWLQASLYFERANVNAGHLELWRDRMLACHSGSDVAMLLTLLPNLEWLAITGYISESPEIQLQLIDLTISLIVQDAIAGLSHPLSNLRTVFIQLYASPAFSVQTLAPFIALPSLERLLTYSDWAGPPHQDYNWPYGPHQSNLQTFELFDTFTNPSQLQRILLPMRQLRSFRYLNDDGFCEYLPFLDTAGCVRSLIDCVGPTLEELTFTGRSGRHTAFESLKAFPKLKRLEIRLVLLSNPRESSSCPRLIDILPPTLQDLILWCDTASCPLHTDRLFEGFSTHPKQALPKLERLNLVERHEDHLEDVLQVLRSTGVQVVVDSWSRFRRWYDPLRWWNSWDWGGQQTRKGATAPETSAWATSPN